MKKLIAYYKRWIHSLYYLWIFANTHDPGDIHRDYTVSTAIKIFGVTIWNKANVIGCSCGEVWYDDLGNNDIKEITKAIFKL